LYILDRVIGEQGETAFARLIAQARLASWLIVIQVRFDDKDKLKAIGGFQWLDGKDPAFPAKSWLRRCKDATERDAVLERIRQEVFDGGAFDCMTGKMTALQRYSQDTTSIRLHAHHVD